MTRKPGWLSRGVTTISTLVREGPPTRVPETDVFAEPPATEVARMLSSFGVALLECGEATNDVRTTLLGIAAAYGVADAVVVVLPTVVFIQIAGETNGTEIGSIADAPFRLDQAGAVAGLVRDARAGQLDPAEAPARLAAIDRVPPRFGWKLNVLGHTVLTLGFGLSLNPTAAALPAYLLLGAIVGLLIALGRRLRILGVVLPVAASFLVTIITALFLADAVSYEPFQLLAPPLLSFLPGLTMTVAAVELTSNEVVAGASRILYGLSQLLLLGFGVYVAFELVGELDPGIPGERLGAWAPWVGVLLTALGYVLFSSAPHGAFPWLLACLYVTTAAQNLGNVVLSPELSGFVGALVIVPLTAAIARFPSAPPSVVIKVPAFWLLVPGALGFIGISQAASEGYDGAEALFNMTLALLSIALGILVGTGVTRNLAAVRRTWNEVTHA